MSGPRNSAAEAVSVEDGGGKTGLRFAALREGVLKAMLMTQGPPGGAGRCPHQHRLRSDDALRPCPTTGRSRRKRRDKREDAESRSTAHGWNRRFGAYSRGTPTRSIPWGSVRMGKPWPRGPTSETRNAGWRRQPTAHHHPRPNRSKTGPQVALSYSDSLIRAATRRHCVWKSSISRSPAGGDLRRHGDVRCRRARRRSRGCRWRRRARWSGR